MNTSILQFAIVKSAKTKFSDAQVLLQEFTGKQFSRNDAETIWTQIINHKWNLGEQLQRDVGFRVAAIDFVENFYQSKRGVENKKSTEMTNNLSSFLKKALKFYFQSKGASLNF